jgi:hypothetical protein
MAPLQSLSAPSACWNVEHHNRGFLSKNGESTGILSSPNRRFHGPSPIILQTHRQIFPRRRSLCVAADEVAAYESWRETKSAQRTLADAGRKQLNHYLNKIVQVVPRTPLQNAPGCHEFPILSVSPAEVWPRFLEVCQAFSLGRLCQLFLVFVIAEGDFCVQLFRHIIASFESSRWNRESALLSKKQAAFVEIFGGVASSVCMADMPNVREHLEGDSHEFDTSSNR